ncbi:peptidase S41-like protein [Dyadobacter jejuensis]|uniref:Peptidase S41-like protein n=1 Tax=Dyadobacter jejuensis TaxID=1082580 RepID=A0A316AAL7_9BACT|nr:S41 family peptidase [Dyadobacter jejuensis]PWJ54733.1 peptidase S41-like protein [Dyadobacter jejuensis]
MRSKIVVIFLLLTAFSLSCKEKSVEPATVSETNQWIYDQMKYWYYWNDQLPQPPDLTQSPTDLFNSLLYKYDATLRPDGDRFSWIQESADELLAGLGGSEKTTGMEFKLSYYPSGTKNVIGLVTYVWPNSPASAAGIKRGNIFTGINNEALTGDNYQRLLNTDGPLALTLGALDSLGQVNTTQSKTLEKLTLQTDPVYFDSLYQIQGKNIGYLVYNRFNPEPYEADNDLYDNELTAVIGKFKDNGVKHLILDLRYNPGGYVSSATHLASLIGKVTNKDKFYIKEYNKTVTPDLEKEYGATFFYDTFALKDQSIGQDLENLIILTSTGTASASELLINGLKPFMTVTVIGGKTVGKNVGSISLTNKKAGITYGLQPIVTKSFNSQMKSDYNLGFVPDVAAVEGLNLYPFGDPRDPLLGEALFKIVGSRTTRRSLTPGPKELPHSEIMSTMSHKAGGDNMFFD